MEFFDLHADIGYDVIQKRRKEETHIIEKYHLKKFREGEISFVWRVILREQSHGGICRKWCLL